MANTGPRSTSSPGSGQNRSASPPALEGSTALRASGVQGRSPVPCAAAAWFSGSQGHTRTSGKGVSGKRAVLSPAVWISCRPASPPRALVASEAPCSPVPTSELHFKAKARSQAGHAALSCRQWALGNSAGVVFFLLYTFPAELCKHVFRWSLKTPSLRFAHLPYLILICTHPTPPHPIHTHTLEIF